MGSRIRNDVTHLFECFFEVVGPSKENSTPWILQKFPEHYNQDEVLSTVSYFAYPCDFDRTKTKYFSFVLTDSESKWTFGFCKHDSKSEIALVVISYLPWHESLFNLLNRISNLTNSDKSKDLLSFLDKVYNSKLPYKGCDLKINNDNGDELIVCQTPIQFKLPSIPENRNLTEYYRAVHSQNMIIIFASMLFERRIIFTSENLDRLSACVQAANDILYPMNWQHLFIPILPQKLIEYSSAPMPYLIGLHHTLFQKQRNDLEGVVILDADNNTIETPFDDFKNLPTNVVSNLKQRLRTAGTLLGNSVSRAFLYALVQLIGGYRYALKFHQGEPISFNEDAFIKSRSAKMQPFLKKLLELQIFQQFKEERLEMLNNGLDISDEFEIAVCNYHEKSDYKLKQQYHAVFKLFNNTAKNVLKNKFAIPTSSASYCETTSHGIQRLTTTTKNLEKGTTSFQPPQLDMNLMDDLKDIIFPRNTSRSLPNLEINSNAPKPLNQDSNIWNSTTDEDWWPMETKDLIQLGSTSSIDDFDPLKSSVNNNGLTPGVGLTNPLYQFCTPLSKTQSETKSNTDLLLEYGLTFNLSLAEEPRPDGTDAIKSTSAPLLLPKPINFKSNWTQ